MTTALENLGSPWPHRWAVALACATFPLVWVGGLVTTTDSGMAVPDWPNTYGYNLFLYPWTSWITGPWSLFLEHGHRLLGATVGMLTIGLLVVLWRCESRRWMRWLGVAALALVVFQGILGGMRVRLDERTLAMLHGTTGPAFFALAVALAVFTSKAWRGAAEVRAMLEKTSGRFGLLRRLAVVTAILAYLQIVVGAVLRHVPVAADPATFKHSLHFHLFLAAVLTIHIFCLSYGVLRSLRHISPLAGLATALVSLVVVQVALGAGTWAVKFAVPAWAASWVPMPSTAIQEGGWVQTHIITAHVAVGSLILATSVTLALHANRLLPASRAAAGRAPRRWEAAV